MIEIPQMACLYIFSNAIRFDAFKQKKENLDEYADLAFQEIKTSLNKNLMSMRPPQLMNQAVGQMRRSDENIASSIRNIETRDQESGSLI